MREEIRNNLIEKIKIQFGEKYILGLIPDKIASRFIAYCSMKHDIELIQKYIKELEKDHSKVIMSSLTYSSIILYSKCFTDASNSNFPKLEPADIFKNEKNHHDFHLYIMDMRNKFLAHRNLTTDEVGIAFFAVPRQESKNELKYKQVKFTGFSKEKLKDFTELISYMDIVLEKKIQKSSNKIFRSSMGGEAKWKVERLN